MTSPGAAARSASSSSHRFSPIESKVKPLACLACRKRKVRCPGTPGETCSQCVRHGLECVYVEHKRGRPLGPKSKDFLLYHSDDPHRQQSTSPSASASINNAPAAGPSHHLSPNNTTNGASGSMASSSTLPVPPLPNSSMSFNEVFTSPMAMILSEKGKQQTTSQNPAQTHQPPAPLVSGGSRVFSIKLDKLQDIEPVACGFCTRDEAVRLFQLFMQHLVGYSALLDPRMHTYEWVAERSVFLMAVIIQAAARRDSNPTFEARSAMIASTLGRHIREVIWPRVVVGNYRSTQVCQAMMIWGAYSNAADIGDEDPSWLLFGHALRVAVSIGLQRNVSLEESGELQANLVARDGQRCWLTCFLADRSWSAQTSRPPLVTENELTMSVRPWLSSRVSNAEDPTIAALIYYRRILTQLNCMSKDTVSLEFQINFCLQEMESWRADWLNGTHATSTRMGKIGVIYYYYGRLLILSRAIQQGQQQAARQAVLEARALCEFSAYQADSSALQYGHNHLYTMIMYGCHCLYHLRAIDNTGAASGALPAKTSFEVVKDVKERIKVAGSTPTHRDDTATWSARKLDTLIDYWNLENMGSSAEVQVSDPTTSGNELFDTSWLELFSNHDLFMGLGYNSLLQGNADAQAQAYPM